MTFKCTLKHWLFGGDAFLVSLAENALVRKWRHLDLRVKQCRLFWSGINSHKNLFFSPALFNYVYFAQPHILTLWTWASWSASWHWCLNSVKYLNEGLQVQTLLGKGVFKTDCKSSLLESVGTEQCLNVSQKKNKYIFH